MQGNGLIEKVIPALVVGWDEEAQGVTLTFDPVQFKTWDFVLAVLDMARQKAEEQKRLAFMQNVQAMQQDAMLQQAVRKKLGG